MIAWATLADIGTAAGTLVLAGATFVAVRASARSTRIAERALLAGQRPVLAPAEQAGGVVYLAIPLRNVGAGLAVLSGYHLQGEPASHVAHDPGGPARHLRGDQPPQPRAFSPQQRDLLISTRRAGFWQAALRDPAIPRSRDPATPRSRDPAARQLTAAISSRGRITVDVRYGDHEGRQPSVTRFVLLPEADSWRCDATRYWSLPPRQR